MASSPSSSSSSSSSSEGSKRQLCHKGDECPFLAERRCHYGHPCRYGQKCHRKQTCRYDHPRPQQHQHQQHQQQSVVSVQTKVSPADVTFVVDTSWSMQRADKLDATKEVILGLLNPKTGLPNEARLGLVTFGSEVDVAIPLQAIKDVRRQAMERVRSVEAEGMTALHEAVMVAAQMQEVGKRTVSGSKRRRKVVVVTDGEDTTTTPSEVMLDALRSLVASDREGDTNVMFYAVGSDASYALEPVRSAAIPRVHVHSLRNHGDDIRRHLQNLYHQEVTQQVTTLQTRSYTQVRTFRGRHHP